jgi:prophage antirepressor-like protein
MSDITLYNFEGSQVRVSLDEKGNPWFVAKDICEVLGYTNSRDALANHVNPKDVAKRDSLTSGGVQAFSAINESGLYSLIMGSRLEGAQRFKHWVTSEVLPSIHKTGSYSRNPAPQQAQYTMKSDAESQASIIRDTMLFMQQLVPSIRPEMAAACTLRALTAGGLMSKAMHEEMRNVLSVDWDKAPSLTPTQIGIKLEGMKPVDVNKMLEVHGFQKRLGRRWEPTSKGNQYAGAVPYQAEHSEHKGVQLKWAPEIVDVLRTCIEDAAIKLLKSDVN